MLEPEIAAFVAAVEAWCPADAATRSPAEQRRIYERFAATWTLASLPEGLVQQDAACQAPDGHTILLRCYRPAHGTLCGTVLFFHGGGFVVGSLDSHALITVRLAADFGLTVIATDYRLAPEHPAPAALNDALIVTRAALDAARFDGLPPVLAIGAEHDPLRDDARVYVEGLCRTNSRRRRCCAVLVRPRAGAWRLAHARQQPASGTDACSDRKLPARAMRVAGRRWKPWRPR